jgi:hypothetical protein
MYMTAMRCCSKLSTKMSELSYREDLIWPAKNFSFRAAAKINSANAR